MKNQAVVMSVYRRIFRFNIRMHFLFFLVSYQHAILIHSVLFLLTENTTYKIKIRGKHIRVGKAYLINSKMTTTGIQTLFTITLVTWIGIPLLCLGDIKPNPGPASLSSSSNFSNSSDMSTNIFSNLNYSHNLSFVQYNVQSILNKLDILQAELYEFDILALTETWLNQSVDTEDLLFQTFNKPERKDRTGDSHGGVMLYVKENIYYKRREDLEIRGVENIWIEIANNHRRILFGLFYRQPNSGANYFNDIEDSIALAVDTGIPDIIITGDFSFKLSSSTIQKKN